MARGRENAAATKCAPQAVAGLGPHRPRQGYDKESDDMAPKVTVYSNVG
jgi:hypothetical protein